MKKYVSIIILAVALLTVQACVSDREKKTSNETTVAKAGLPTLAEKRADMERQRKARTEKRLAELEAKVKASPNFINGSGNVVYYKAEVNPAFKGGEKALTEYLSDNLKYPKKAEEQGVEGTVFVEFVVMSDGSVKEVEVPNEVGVAIDQSLIDEAARVVLNMPDWIPGQHRGKLVDVKFSLPITFQIN